MVVNWKFYFIWFQQFYLDYLHFANNVIAAFVDYLSQMDSENKAYIDRL